MTPEGKAAYINAMVACAQIEAAGMTAENMDRQHRGQAMAYVDDDFNKLIDKYGIHHNAIITMLNTP